MNQWEVLVGGKIGYTGACLTSLCPSPPAPGPPQAPSYSERFCGNIGPADSKGHSSCVTLVTLVLSITCLQGWEFSGPSKPGIQKAAGLWGSVLACGTMCRMGCVWFLGVKGELFVPHPQGP